MTIIKEKANEYQQRWRAKNGDTVSEQRKRAKAKVKKRMQSDPKYREEQLRKKRENARKHFIHNMYKRAKDRALRNGLVFTLKEEDIVVPSVCPILGVPFRIGTKGDYLYTYSLDRVNVRKGYTKANSRVITMLANSMKNAATKKQLEAFAGNIIPYLNSKI